MYCLVEFGGPSQDIEIAHRSWINGSKCYWPPFWKNNSKLRSALKKGTAPDPTTWNLFEVHIIGGKFFGNNVHFIFDHFIFELKNN